MNLKTCLAACLLAGAAVAGTAALPTVPDQFVPKTSEESACRPLARQAAGELRKKRAELLRQLPISVTFDKRLPAPSGDPRDFTSCGPYWWPDAQRPDGLPYIRRDGRVNPDFKFYDQSKTGLLVSRVSTGALLWRLDRDEAAAAGAVKLLKVFFVDEATRMNPHMKYAQGVPGRSSGRTEGIIDTLLFTDLVDMTALLKDAPAMTPELYGALQEWFRAYIRWLLTDPMALRDFGRKQNHGLSYHVQLIAFARFCDHEALARTHLQIMRGLIAEAVDEHGFLPEEIGRTRSWHYSAYALSMMMRAVGAGRTMDVDLLDPHSPSGRALRRAMERMMSYLLDPAEKWPHPLLKGKIEPGVFCDVVIQYSAYTGSETARRTLARLPKPKISPANRICFAPAEPDSQR